MCATKPFYQFEVSEQRMAKVMELLSGKDASGKVLDPRFPKGLMSKLTNQQAMEVAFELGFGDALHFDPQGPLQLDMTDLQLIALVAGLAAAAECQGRQVEA